MRSFFEYSIVELEYVADRSEENYLMPTATSPLSTSRQCSLLKVYKPCWLSPFYDMNLELILSRFSGDFSSWDNMIVRTWKEERDGLSFVIGKGIIWWQIIFNPNIVVSAILRASESWNIHVQKGWVTRLHSYDF